MTFHTDQRVVYPGFGLGRIATIVTKAMFDAELHEFYEVIGEHSTVWVQVSEAADRGLRRLTRQAELPHFRSLLRGQPVALSPEARLRHRDILARFKRGTLDDLCQIVRDLSAHGWHNVLDEYDVAELKKSQRWLCQEWAVADSVELAQAGTEVNALLREARLQYDGQPGTLD